MLFVEFESHLFLKFKTKIKQQQKTTKKTETKKISVITGNDDTNGAR